MIKQIKEFDIAMVSIIVPVYKTEKYLRKCVEAILAQTYKDLEIILVDDGSPDTCPLICDELAKTDNRIKVIHKENGGLSSARNEGLKEATGKYITFVDSDDTINPQMIECLFKALLTNNADISMCGCRTITSEGKLLAMDTFEDCHIYKNEELINNVVLPLKTACWNKLFKRSVIKGHLFPERRIHGEDLVFISSIINDKTTLVTTDYIGYNYYKRGCSITTSSFNNSAFDEVWCKDKATQILIEKFPSFENETLLWRFRARMNIIRSISKNDITTQYLSKIVEYKMFLEHNYKSVSRLMRLHEKIEFFLFKHIVLFYNVLVKYR